MNAEPTDEDSIPSRAHARDTNGRFQAGNSAWKARALSAGHAPRFTDGASLWKACVEYFEWVEANPLYEDQIVTWQGAVTHVAIPRMRVMSKRGLCRFLGIARTTWTTWRDRPELGRTIEDAESVIATWKFEGAAAGLLNPAIIWRELKSGHRDAARSENAR